VMMSQNSKLNEYTFQTHTGNNILPEKLFRSHSGHLHL